MPVAAIAQTAGGYEAKPATIPNAQSCRRRVRRMLFQPRGRGGSLMVGSRSSIRTGASTAPSSGRFTKRRRSTTTASPSTPTWSPRAAVDGRSRRRTGAHDRADVERPTGSWQLSRWRTGAGVFHRRLSADRLEIRQGIDDCGQYNPTTDVRGDRFFCQSGPDATFPIDVRDGYMAYDCSSRLEGITQPHASALRSLIPGAGQASASVVAQCCAAVRPTPPPPRLLPS